MEYILITADKTKLLISKDQRDAVMTAINNNAKCAIIQDQVISLQIMPSIFTFDTWYTQENSRLSNTDRRLCRKCLNPMDIFTGCKCWESNGAVKEKTHAFASVLPPELKRQLLPKPFPDLTETDKLGFGLSEQGMMVVTGEDQTGEYYIDEESGEKMYS